MDRVELRRLLDELAAELRRRRVTARVYLVGGAAMILAYDAARTTRDLDVLVLEGHGPVVEAAQVVARRHDLPGSWLNEQAPSYLPSGDDLAARVVFDEPGLTVLAASAPRLLGIASADEVEELVQEVMPDQPLSDRSRTVLRDVVG